MSKFLRVLYVSVFDLFPMLPLTLKGLDFSSVFNSAVSRSSRAAICVIVHRPAFFLSDLSTRNDEFFFIPQALVPSG